MEKYIVSMQCEAQHPIYVGIPSINSISNTEVQFQISVGLGCQHQLVPDMTKSTRGEPPTNTHATYFSIRC